MFRLPAGERPNDARSLAAAIESSLKELFSLPRGRRAVEVSAGSYPSIDSLRIDLSGARFTLADLPSAPLPTGRPTPGPTVRQFELVARPLRWHDAELDIHATARDVAFSLREGQHDGAIAVLDRLAGGTVEMRITLDSLERALLAAAQMAAADHGVTIKDVHLSLRPRADEPNTLAGEVEVEARKLLTGVIRVAGQMTIDDDLNLRLTRLSCRGSGVVGSLACRLLQPHLERLGARPVPLARLPSGAVRFREVRVHVDEGALRIGAALAC